MSHTRPLKRETFQEYEEPLEEDTEPSGISDHINRLSIADQNDASGQQVGPYQLMRQLGEGGWGKVYLAEDTTSGRQVAIKFLRREFQTQIDDPVNTLKRFEHEVRAAQSVTHPNLIQVFDYKRGSSKGPYIVMEYQQGETLQERLYTHGAIPPTELITLFGQISEGLAAVHRRGIVYRDLKPSNIYLIPIYGYELVKLLDFGNALVPQLGRLSVEDQIIGTPLYMSPEQIVSPAEITTQSDIYAFGMLFYEALTGEPLFKEKNPPKLFRLHCSDNKPLHHPKITRSLRSVLSKLLDQNPEKRPHSIEFAWCLLEDALLNPNTEPHPKHNPPTPTPPTTPLVINMNDTIEQQGPTTQHQTSHGNKTTTKTLPGNKTIPGLKTFAWGT